MSEPRQIIWSVGLDDDKYQCVVERLSENKGQLIVTEKASNQEVMSETVHLSYGAQFGADYFDILTWQEMISSRIPEPK